MFTYELLKNCGGIALWGTYSFLNAVHEVIHDVNERSVIIKNKEGYFLGLAYDLRKAYEGQRRISTKEHDEEHGRRYGVEFLWPTILFQSRQFRTSLAFMDHSKLCQAIAFDLEFVIEKAIRDQFKNGDLADQIVREWEGLGPDSPDFTDQKMGTRIAQFAAWRKKERLNGLLGLLMSMNPLYDKILHDIWVRSGVKNLVPPADLEQWSDPNDFPDAGPL